MDSTIPVNLPPRNRATSRAKSTRLWKMAKAQPKSESELSDIEEEFAESYMEDSEDLSDPDYEITDGKDVNPTRDTRPIKPTKIEVDHVASGNSDRIFDTQGEPQFEPDEIYHLVVTSDHIAKYIASRVLKPFEKAK
ncbi:Hypothetical predicted protein [Pelobates cultripes]|uniref:Uncharacterized protein n=1 Tax=Pelobates cultripes TaxID=61616 RepID=A0AAD1RR97_PELCU|nr:Hypothetical predicted protein [Pelobates cultripes]